MAAIDIGWAETGLISVFEEARDLGFDLRKFNDQTDEVKAAVKKATIDRVISMVRDAWRASYDHEYAATQDFNAIRNGVYVISIGDGFAVKYKGGCSEVMYIGRGVIANRIRSHLSQWIFDMSLSLRDVPFRFYMETIGDRRSKDSFKDFEHHLLAHFSNKFSEKPLVNKIHGREGHIKHRFSGNWKRPFDGRGKRYMWEIRPSKNNSWFKEYKDD
jgi:hypothetical protein